MASKAHLAKGLAALFTPRSVAIVGASATPFKHGNVALRYLLAGGFQGEVYPVNAGGGQIEGLDACRSVLDIPGEIDCALFLIPAAATAQALRDCVAKGARAVIIGSSGFAEQGTDEGRARQREVLEIASEHGVCVLGPNTNGVWNASHRFSLGFNTSHGDAITPGAISIAAHSGALMNSLAPAIRRFGAGLNKYVPVGNEANLDLLDIFEFLIADESTRCIGLIVEGIADGPRFKALAQAARKAGKPVVALKLGRSKAGAAAALAHASRLAGSARAYDAFLHGCGVAQAASIESFAGACVLLADGAPRRGEGDWGLVGISTSGGGAELLADHAQEAGVALAGDGVGGWPAAVPAYFATIPGAGLVRNPVDSGNLAGVTRIDDLLKVAEAEGCNGPVALFAHQLPQESRDLQVAQIMVDRRARTGAPVVCISPGGLRDSVAAFYANHGIAVFSDSRTAFDALRCYVEQLDAPLAGAPPALPDDAKAGITAQLARAPRDLLSEAESAAILAAAGVPMAPSFHVATLEDAQQQAQAHGGRMVLKAMAPGVAHKNDAGLVAVGLETSADIARAWAAMHDSLRKLNIAADRVEFILQPMLTGQVELIAGLAHEPPLGHFLVAGLGGLLAEALDEVILIAVPASRERIAATLDASRIGKLLHRLDAQAAAPVTPRLVDTLCSLQALALAFPERIRSVDVNPLLAGKDHCTAVDALIELQPSSGA